MKKLLVFIIVVTLFTSCFLSDIEKPGVVVDAQLAADLLREATDTLNIGIRSIMEVEIYKNLMPGTENQAISVGTELIAIDSLSYPFSTRLARQYVIKNDTIWIADHQDPINNYDSILVYIVPDGPEWDLGDFVDVVSKAYDPLDGSVHYVIKENVEIQGAY